MLTIRPQIEPKKEITFNGFRPIDPETIIYSDPETQRAFLQANEDIMGPDFIDGEQSLGSFLLNAIKRAFDANDGLSRDTRKVREGLDLIA